MKYTDAEWKAERDELHFGTLSSIVAGPQESGRFPRYPLMIEVGGSAGLEEQEGNTRLASAALDMYKALVNAEKMLAQFLCVVNTNAVQPHLGFGLKDSVTEVFTKDSLGIRAAIAKAEGTN